MGGFRVGLPRGYHGMESWPFSGLAGGDRLEQELLAFQDHIKVQGWPAIFVSASLVFSGFCLHVSSFWGRFAKYEWLSSVIAVCCIFAAGILFTIGIVAWSIKTVMYFFG